MLPCSFALKRKAMLPQQAFAVPLQRLQRSIDNSCRWAVDTALMPMTWKTKNHEITCPMVMAIARLTGVSTVIFAA